MTGRCLLGVFGALGIAIGVQGQPITVDFDPSWASVSKELEGMDVVVTGLSELHLRAMWVQTDPPAEITDACDWVSSDEEVVQSHGDGVFTITGPGTVEITASLGAMTSPTFLLVVHDQIEGPMQGIRTARDGDPPIPSQELKNRAQELIEGLPSELDKQALQDSHDRIHYHDNDATGSALTLGLTVLDPNGEINGIYLKRVDISCEATSHCCFRSMWFAGQRTSY